MKIYHHISKYQNTQKSILTIGTFDGVHLGHQKVLQNIVIQCNTNNLKSLVLTFNPTPFQFFSKKEIKNNLNSIDEKVNSIEKLGIDALIIQEFDESMADLEAEKFVKDILINQFNIKKIVIGYDHRFGKNRAAGFEELLEFGKKYDFEVEKITAFEYENNIISSSKIRNFIENGSIEIANQYLGSEYSITGKVIDGKKIGNSIGFPTVNLEILDQKKIIPKIGVYFVKVFHQKKKYFGMMNIGFNPTFNNEIISIEVHIFEFNENIYHQEIKVSFINRLRDEIKFGSKLELINQLEKDKMTCLSLIKIYNKTDI